jgi:hypothetical protein
MRRAKTVLRRVLIALGVLMLAIIVAGVVHALNRPGDRTRIERTIEAVATTTDPSYCDSAMTDAYMEQVTGVGRPFADEACEGEASRRGADSVEVSHVSIDGDRAIAVVTYRGGSLDGSTARIRLVREGRRWKVDRRLAITRFNRERFRRAYRIRFQEFGAPKSAVRCALTRERRLTDPEVKRYLLSDDPDPFARIAVECDREGIERSLLGSVAGAELDAAGTRCAERRLASEPGATLARLQFDLPAHGRLIAACDRDAVVAYAHRKLVAEGDESPAEIACIVDALRALPPAGQFRLTYDEERYEALYDRCEG